MNVREFNNSKLDFLELSEMHIDLINYSEDTFASYAVGVSELISQLKQNGCRCFIIEVGGEIAGYSIIIPDGKGGVVAQSLYLKEQYRGTSLFGHFLKWMEEYIDENFKYCTVIATNDKISAIYDKRYTKRYTVYLYTPQGENHGN